MPERAAHAARHAGGRLSEPKTQPLRYGNEAWAPRSAQTRWTAPLSELASRGGEEMIVKRFIRFTAKPTQNQT
eukprot:SAG11_NODE_23507_length_387_cov_1.215278_1_plen_72_part_10